RRDRGGARGWRARAGEGPVGGRGGGQGRGVGPARRLPEDGDLVRVAAEGGDVVAHPLERAHQVERPEVPRALGVARALAAERGMAEPAERAEAVVEGDDDDVLGRGELAPVEE